jgi:hypothetical protein
MNLANSAILSISFFCIFFTSCSSSDDSYQEVIFESRGPSDFVSDLSLFQINGSNCPSVKTFSLPDSAFITGFETSFIIEAIDGRLGTARVGEQVSFLRFYSGDQLLAQTPIIFGPDSNGTNNNESNSFFTFLLGNRNNLAGYTSNSLPDLNGNPITNILAGHKNISVELHIGRTNLLDTGFHPLWDPSCQVVGTSVFCPTFTCIGACSYLIPREQPDDPCDTTAQALVENEWRSKLFYAD